MKIRKINLNDRSFTLEQERLIDFLSQEDRFISLVKHARKVNNINPSLVDYKPTKEQQREIAKFSIYICSLYNLSTLWIPTIVNIILKGEATPPNSPIRFETVGKLLKIIVTEQMSVRRLKGLINERSEFITKLLLKLDKNPPIDFGNILFRNEISKMRQSGKTFPQIQKHLSVKYGESTTDKLGETDLSKDLHRYLKKSSDLRRHFKNDVLREQIVDEIISGKRKLI